MNWVSRSPCVMIFIEQMSGVFNCSICFEAKKLGLSDKNRDIDVDTGQANG